MSRFLVQINRVVLSGEKLVSIRSGWRISIGLRFMAWECLGGSFYLLGSIGSCGYCIIWICFQWIGSICWLLRYGKYSSSKILYIKYWKTSFFPLIFTGLTFEHWFKETSDAWRKLFGGFMSQFLVYIDQFFEGRVTFVFSEGFWVRLTWWIRLFSL